MGLKDPKGNQVKMTSRFWENFRARERDWYIFDIIPSGLISCTTISGGIKILKVD
jgi:hypothetical protein